MWDLNPGHPQTKIGPLIVEPYELKNARPGETRVILAFAASRKIPFRAKIFVCTNAEVCEKCAFECETRAPVTHIHRSKSPLSEALALRDNSLLRELRIGLFL